ncbi:MAG: hypothetical protein NUW01_10750 [Gemmatimonadaceae bacterium]|nr:hypothetical protein [Gemmatimonadaceae bacterium]
MSPLKNTTYTPVDEGDYVIQLKSLEDTDPGQYGARMRWTFRLWNMATGVQVIDEQTGEPFDWWQTTSESIAERSTGRPWVEAFLGRKIAKGENAADISREIIDKTAEAYIGPNERDYTTILRIKARQRKAATAAPAAAPAPAPAPYIEPDDLPF